MQNQRGFIGVGVLIAIILGIVVLGGGAYYVVQKNTPSQTAIDTTNVNTVPTKNNQVPQQSSNGTTGSTVPSVSNSQTTASLSNHAVGTIIENLFDFLQKTPNVPGTSYPVFKYQNNQIVFVGSTKDRGCVVPVANPAKVQVPLKFTRAQTINGTLTCNTILTKPDKDGLCVEADSYLIEGNTLFNVCQKVGQIDVSRFRFLNTRQWSTIYTDGKVVGMQFAGGENLLLSGIADPPTLEPVFYRNEDTPYLKDAQNIYFLRNLHPETDTKAVVVSTDVSSFEVILSEPNEVGTLYARDRSHIYSEENILPTTNLSAFETFGRGGAFGIDESRVYLLGKIIHSGTNKSDVEVYLQNPSPDWDGPPSSYSVFIKNIRTNQWYKQDSSSPISAPSSSEIGAKLFPKS